MIVLREDQLRLITSARTAFLNGHRSVLMVAPTGFGKTVCFSHLASEVAKKNKRVFILAHRSELLDQIGRTLTQFNIGHRLIAPGVPISDFPVQIASVQTLARRISAYQPPDLLIIDEAHHAIEGSTWGKVLAAWPRSFKLGVTATPQRLSGHGLRGNFQTMIIGPTVRELIDAGSLCEYRLFAPPQPDIGKLHIRGGDFAKMELTTAVDKPQLVGSAVAHYKKLTPGKRAIVFCVSLDHARHTADQFISAGFNADRIDGKLESNKRKQLVSDFTDGKLQVLTSCDIVSEGFDLPAIECAILMRPTQSLALHMQQVGRALRPSPGKDFAAILDHAGNTYRHGLPDDDRLWSLDGHAERKSKHETESSLRTCGNCFAALRSHVCVCPHCGFVFQVEPRTVDEVDGELSEIDIALLRQQRKKEQSFARTLEDLIALGKQRHYKNPVYWATKVMQGRR